MFRWPGETCRVEPAAPGTLEFQGTFEPAWSDAVSRLTDLERTALDVLDGMKADERWFGSGRRILERGRRDPRRQEIARYVKEHAPDEAAARRELEALRDRRNAMLAKLGAMPGRPVKRVSVLCDRLADGGLSASEIMRLLEALGAELRADSVNEDGVDPMEALRARVQRRIDRARLRRTPKGDAPRAAKTGSLATPDGGLRRAPRRGHERVGK